MKHAPGPWRTGPINYADVYDAEGNLVALVIKGLPGTESNAKLITAAPDLLAACKEWVEIDGPTVSLAEQKTRWVEVVDKMKAAIAKAEATA